MEQNACALLAGILQKNKWWRGSISLKNLQFYPIVLQPQTKTLYQAKVVAVTGLNSNRLCVACKKGYITIDEDPLIGKCSTCPTIALIDDCPLECSAILTLKSNTFTYKLNASGKHLATITNTTDLKILPMPNCYSHPLLMSLNQRFHSWSFMLNNSTDMNPSHALCTLNNPINFWFVVHHFKPTFSHGNLWLV